MRRNRPSNADSGQSEQDRSRPIQCESSCGWLSSPCATIPLPVACLDADREPGTNNDSGCDTDSLTKFSFVNYLTFCGSRRIATKSQTKLTVAQTAFSKQPQPTRRSNPLAPSNPRREESTKFWTNAPISSAAVSRAKCPPSTTWTS